MPITQLRGCWDRVAWTQDLETIMNNGARPLLVNDNKSKTKYSLSAVVLALTRLSQEDAEFKVTMDHSEMLTQKED